MASLPKSCSTHSGGGKLDGIWSSHQSGPSSIIPTGGSMRVGCPACACKRNSSADTRGCARAEIGTATRFTTRASALGSLCDKRVTVLNCGSPEDGLHKAEEGGRKFRKLTLVCKAS